MSFFSLFAPAQFIYASTVMLNAHAASRADIEAYDTSRFQGIKPAMQHVESILNAGYKEEGNPLTVGFSSNGPGINVSATIEMTDEDHQVMAELRMLFTYLPALPDVELKRIEVDTPALLHARLEQTNSGTSLYVHNYMPSELIQKLLPYVKQLQDASFSHFDGMSRRVVTQLHYLLEQNL